MNQHREKAQLRELAGEDWEKDGESEDSQTLAQLRETIKTERDQKVFDSMDHCFCHFPLFQNYFEELVSVRDNQLARLKLELQSLSTESEAQKRDLDGIVLELQTQV